MKFTLSLAQCAGDKSNVFYPNEAQITSKDELLEAVQKDHVCGTFEDNRRSKADFRHADCLVMDCDNDHSDEPEEWISLDDLDCFFGFEVSYAAVTSRSHMKEKGGRSPRPRFHVYLPLEKPMTGAPVADLKKRIFEKYRFFDQNALDESRFVFGCKPEEAIWQEGMGTIENFLNTDCPLKPVCEGSRNTTMYRKACQLLVRYGQSESTWDRFIEASKCCTPLLDDEELQQIWNSAMRFYTTKVTSNPDYIEPDEYSAGFRYRPVPACDVDMARMVAQFFSDRLRHSTQTRFLCYNGQFWEANDPKATLIVHKLTDLQLAEAEPALDEVKKEFERLKIAPMLTTKGAFRKDAKPTEEQRRCVDRLSICVGYVGTAHYYRDNRHINGVLSQAKGLLDIDVNELDADPYLLNTPAGTVDLRTGKMNPHRSEDMITKMTSVSPSMDGKELWEDSLNKTFQHNQELIDYVQEICGLMAIGKVMLEMLFIAHGEGSNGKSTFWNTIGDVMGSYYGKISADTLTSENKLNVKPELAELKGKRIIIASELPAGRHLSNSMVKHLSSTDEIQAEKKYCDPMKFRPSHSVILYTNHLPAVDELDYGTWRRLTIIPFNATFKGSGVDPNFAARVLEESGGYILTWIIEGAKRIIDKDCRPDVPQCVLEATNAYREDNDWLNDFLRDCCLMDPREECAAGELYDAYRNWCQDRRENQRGKKAFKESMSSKGFEQRKYQRRFYYQGLKLLPKAADDFDEEAWLNSPDCPF